MKVNPCTPSFSFQYHIDLGNSKISHILITEQSDPYVQASKFCAREALPSILVTVLGDAMRDQMHHQRGLVEARQRNNSGKSVPKGSEPYSQHEIVLSDTLNTQLKEDNLRGNLSSWLHDSSSVNKKQAYRSSVFQQLYNNYRQIEKKKELSRKKSFEAIPFRPTINHLSEKIVLNKRRVEQEINISQTRKSAQKGQGPSSRSKCKLTYNVCGYDRSHSRESVYHRTSTYLKRSEEKRRRLRDSIEKKLMESCSFKPKINQVRIR